MKIVAQAIFLGSISARMYKYITLRLSSQCQNIVKILYKD